MAMLLSNGFVNQGKSPGKYCNIDICVHEQQRTTRMRFVVTCVENEPEPLNNPSNV